jgi:uncharacterized protein YdeI (YjbR/CyaY-like superfamily)
MPKAAKGKGGASAMKFEATLERMRSRLNWIIIRVPYDAAKVFGVRGQINVAGTINGFPFRTALFPTREGHHILLVNKKMQKGAGVREGSVAQFALERDTQKRVAKMPEGLQRILARDRALREWFDGLNQSTKNEIAKWVNQPESAAARNRRVEQIAERLMETMDAERELPPMLRLAFARNPQAQDGWEQMSSARRRSHLLAIFYYRTPEGRANRMNKMLDDAVAIAEKNS